MTVYYVDKNRGSDSNDGLSAAAPWKELTKIDDAAKAAGGMILLADDSEWEYNHDTRVIVPTSWAGTRANPVVIGKYSPSSQSTGQRPIIRWNYKIQASDWTYSAPNNAWTYTAPRNPGFLALLRINGTWETSRTDDFVADSVPLDSVDGRYNASGAVLYMYAPAGTDPTTYYGEVLLGCAGSGFFTCSNNTKFTRFEGLRFERTGCGIFAYSDTAADVGIAVDDIEAETCSAIVVANTVGANGQLYANIKRIKATDWGPAVVHGVATNGAGFREFDVSLCDIQDGMHSHSQGAIYNQVRTAGLRPRIHHNTFDGVRWGTQSKEADGSAIYCETGSDATDVEYNIVRNAYCAFQDGSGRSNRFRFNVLIDCWSACQVGDPANNNATNHEFSNNTCLVGNARLKPTYGEGRTSTGWRCFDNSGGAMVLTVRNNLFFDQTGNTTRAAVIVPQTEWSGDIVKNAVFGFSTVAEKEFAGGAGADPTPTGTVTDDPMVSGDGRPLSESPLLGAGVHIRYGRDIEGRQTYNPPSIGAYERMRERRARS